MLQEVPMVPLISGVMYGNGLLLKEMKQIMVSKVVRGNRVEQIVELKIEKKEEILRLKLMIWDLE